MVELSNLLKTNSRSVCLFGQGPLSLDCGLLFMIHDIIPTCMYVCTVILTSHVQYVTVYVSEYIILSTGVYHWYCLY